MNTVRVWVLRRIERFLLGRLRQAVQGDPESAAWVLSQNPDFATLVALGLDTPTHAK